MKNRKLIIVLSFFFIFVLVGIFINNAFFKPTKLNSFIAAKIYKSPANIAFTDDNLYQCVVDAYNNGKTSEEKVEYTYNLSDRQLKSITSLSCNSTELGVKWYNDISGIEKLTGLETLGLNHNTIKEIDLSYYPNLKELYLVNNYISELDFSNNPLLEIIDIRSNELTKLDVSNLNNLKELLVGNGYRKGTIDYDITIGNNINELNVANNILLEELHLNYNNISEIDVSNNTNLESLWLIENNLSKINVSNNTLLKYLYADKNKITEIDLTKNVNLRDVDLGDNYIVGIDLINNKNLQQVYLDHNNLSNVMLPDSTELYRLHVNNNKLKEIDVSNNDGLTNLYLDNNNLDELNISNNPNLKLLSADDNNLSTLEISNNTLLEQLSLKNNQLTSLDVSKNTKLELLALSDEPYEEIKELVNNNITISYDSLLEIYKSRYKLKNLDLTNNKTLETTWGSSITFFEEDAVYVSHYDEFLINKSTEWDTDNESSVTPPISWEYGIVSRGNFEILYNSSSTNGGILETREDGSKVYEKSIMYSTLNAYDSNDGYSKINIYRLMDLHVLSLTSNIYTIDNESSTIDLGDIKIDNNILENFDLNQGTMQINANKLQLVYNDKIIKEFDIITTYKEKININDFEVSNSINNESKWLKGYRGNISFNISSDDIQDFSNFDIKVLKEENEISSFYISKSIEENILKVNVSSLVSTDPNTFDTGNYIINIYNGDTLLETQEFEIYEPIKITEIEINDVIINYRDSNLTIDYNILPKNATNQNLTFTIDDTTIAQLDIYNKINPQNVGETNLTLTTHDGSDIEKTVSITVKDFGFTQNTFKIDYNNKIIRKINAKLLYSDFVNNFIKQDLATLGIYLNEEEMNSTDYVSTNSILKSNFNGTNNNFTVIVDGDINGDGQANATDIIYMKRHILGKSTLDDILFTAGDIDENNSVNATDIMYMKRYILGKTDNVWGS